MKLLYKKVFKNNQVTYGRPYQINIPADLQRYTDLSDYHDYENDEMTDPEDLLEKTKHKCELLISEAEQKAEKLLENAHENAKTQVENRLEEAWQRGYAEGLEAAASQSRSLLEEAGQIRQKTAEEYEKTMAGMETDILELVLEVSQKAVAGELATNKEVILQLVRNALPNCSNKNGAVIRVSPQDGEFLAENIEELSIAAEGADNLEIKNDCALKPGDCIIETVLGSVDAGAGTRLNKIGEAFTDILTGR